MVGTEDRAGQCGIIAMAVYKRGRVWWYKFTWNGEPIRESTKQTNKRTAEQMEAAHKTSLAKGEVGLRDRKLAPTLREFAEDDFLPFVRSTFAAKQKTLKYYEYGVKSLLAFEKLADARLDTITGETIGGFVAKRRERGLEVSSINRELQALRRMFHLAEEWNKVEKALPTVKMVPGEKHRERVLTPQEESLYFRAANTKAMEQHADPRLLADVGRILLDCALRPEECFRLRRGNVVDGKLEIHSGKTDNARRRIPMTPNVQAILEMRLSKPASVAWVFPAATQSGHIEPSSLKKQHAKAVSEATRILREETQDPRRAFAGFELYTLRHTCLTRWAPHMDPWTLAYLAGHRDMNTTKRYVHPQEQTILVAMEKARAVRGGHSSGHTELYLAAANCSKRAVKN
jgi:integrase